MRRDEPTRVLWMSEDDKKIRMHLVYMCRKGIISLKSFGSRDIKPAAQADERKKELIREAQIILAPITPELGDDAMAGFLEEAFARHRAGDALVVPVLVRPTSLKHSPFEHLEPIVSRGVWLEVEPAHASESRWARVPEGVERSMEELSRRQVAVALDAGSRADSTHGRALANQSGEETMSNIPDSRRPDGLTPKLRRILRENEPLGQHYKLLARIGIDAVSTIWRAIDTRDGKIITIRVLHDAIASDWDKRRCVSLHTRALTDIRHPALIEVLQSETHDGGISFYVTQFFEGTPLRREALRRPMDEVAVISLVLHIGRALELAHDQGLAHGDIRPANLLSDGASPPKLSDFPVLWSEERARQGGSGAYEAHLYTAPESSRPGARPTPQGDVYSLARTAVFCLRGSELPEENEGGSDPLFSSLRCAEGVKEVLKKAAHPDRSARYQGAKELCDALLEEYRADPRELVPMVTVEGGEFTMGDDASELRSDKPEHRVTVSSFSIGKYPVTQRQYRQIMLCNPSYSVGDELPVNRVSFHDALEFCNRLSALEGHEQAYTIRGDEVVWSRAADGYRLPTEAEWEYAARGPEGRRFPWGDEEPSAQVCWSGPGNDAGPQGRRGPSPVGKYPDGATPGPDGIPGLPPGAGADSPPDGIMDLAGNVWEWCWDWHDLYPTSRAHRIDPCGPDQPCEPALRALRGAAWNEQKRDLLRAAVRSREEPSARDPDIGFRVVRSLRPRS